MTREEDAIDMAMQRTGNNRVDQLAQWRDNAYRTFSDAGGHWKAVSNEAAMLRLEADLVEAAFHAGTFVPPRSYDGGIFNGPTSQGSEPISARRQ